eukprot:Sspe_Gene.100945::Locus_75588_Transcript_3_3_Confidence_0.667_Length_2516::g.100945::m.100945
MRRAVMVYTDKPEYKFGDITRATVHKILNRRSREPKALKPCVALEDSEDEWMRVTTQKEGQQRSRGMGSRCEKCLGAFTVTLWRHECALCRGLFCWHCCHYKQYLIPNSAIQRTPKKMAVCSSCFSGDNDPLRTLHFAGKLAVLQWLSIRDIASAMLVSCSWNAVARSPELWHILIQRDGIDLSDGLNDVVYVPSGRTIRVSPSEIARRDPFDIYAMAATRRYVPLSFSERTLPQKVGLGTLAVVGSPFILIYLLPDITGFVGKKVVDGAMYGATHIVAPCVRAAERGVECAVENAVLPAIDASCRGVQYVYRHMLVPTGRVLAKGAEFTFIDVPSALFRHGVVPASRFTYDYMLVPLAVGTKAVLRTVFITVPREIFHRVLNPLYGHSKTLGNTMYESLLVPIGKGAAEATRFIFVATPVWAWRTLFRPTLTAAANVLVWSATKVEQGVTAVVMRGILPVLRAGWRYVVEPVGYGVCVSIVFTFETLPRLIYQYVVYPGYTHVVKPVGRLMKHAARMLAIALPVMIYNRALYPAYKNLLLPAASGITASCFFVGDLAATALRHCARALTAGGRAVHSYLLLPLYAGVCLAGQGVAAAGKGVWGGVMAAGRFGRDYALLPALNATCAVARYLAAAARAAKRGVCTAAVTVAHAVRDYILLPIAALARMTGRAVTAVARALYQGVVHPVVRTVKGCLVWLGQLIRSGATAVTTGVQYLWQVVLDGVLRPLGVLLRDAAREGRRVAVDVVKAIISAWTAITNFLRSLF